MNQVLIGIFAQTEQEYKIAVSLNQSRIQHERFEWFDSTRSSRLKYINQNPKTWILFIDSDCVVPQEVIEYINNLSRTLDHKNRVFSGGYLNPSPSKYLQKVHNHIANIWVEQSVKRFLGGVFLIYSNSYFSESEINECFFWGGEDECLANILNRHNFIFKKDPKVQVYHYTSNQFVHFVRRAFLHGLKKTNYKKEQLISINKLFFSCKNYVMLPGVLFHYLILGAGLLVGTALQVRSKNKFE